MKILSLYLVIFCTFTTNSILLNASNYAFRWHKPLDAVYYQENNKVVEHEGELQDSLNGIEKLMTGRDTFNQEFLLDLTQCFAKLDLKLPSYINDQWKGFKTYAASKVYPPSDAWKRCSDTFQRQNDSFHEEMIALRCIGKCIFWG